MEYQVYRVNYSSYQDKDFLYKEKEIIETIPGTKYIFDPSEFIPGRDLILITNTHSRPHELASHLLSETKLMIHPNSGFDNFSREFIEEANFPIIQGNEIRGNAVSEYILSSLFSHFTKIPNHYHWDSGRKWERSLLRDQKILIMGGGIIGTTIYHALKPLVRNLNLYDPYKQDTLYIKKEMTDELIREVDVLILATSLNKENFNLINKEFLKKISKRALIINASRGELINEDDLQEFLKENEEAFAYLDVYKKEPYSPSFFTSLQNINKTSHIAGVFKNLNLEIIYFEKRIIKEFIENKLDIFLENNKDILMNERIKSLEFGN